MQPQTPSTPPLNEQPNQESNPLPRQTQVAVAQSGPVPPGVPPSHISQQSPIQATQPTLRRPGLPLVIFVLCGLLALGAGLFVARGFGRFADGAQQSIKDMGHTRDVFPVQHDPAMVALAKEAGITDIKKVSLLPAAPSADKLEVSFARELPEGERGTYRGPIRSEGVVWEKADGVIQIVDTGDHAAMRRTLAHEYMHYVWANRKPANEKQQLTTELTRLYDAYPPLQEIMRDWYIPRDGKVKTTELYAYFCTSIADAHLTPDLIADCNRYVSRDKIL